MRIGSVNDGYFLSRTTIKLGKKLCVFCLVLAVLNIAGRFFDIDLLTKLHNELTSMTPNTTILDRSDYTLKEIILPLVEIIEPEAAARNIHLHTHILEAKKIINCDAVRIRQVLSNLIGNALKFTPAAGNIEVSVQRNDGEVIFCVSDSGRGISNDNLEKVFEKFWQSSNAKKMGSGLGLSICKAIVEAHGGKIWATSELNKGSRFYFSLTTQS